METSASTPPLSHRREEKGGSAAPWVALDLQCARLQVLAMNFPRVPGAPPTGQRHSSE